MVADERETRVGPLARALLLGVVFVLFTAATFDRPWLRSGPLVETVVWFGGGIVLGVAAVVVCRSVPGVSLDTVGISRRARRVLAFVALLTLATVVRAVSVGAPIALLLLGIGTVLVATEVTRFVRRRFFS